ncbi:MAG: hypothetical protein JO042_04350 [Sinobacteraceae bacterium]|nr:hypothetical protein [Nevskiaceae bacterium]
MASVIVSIEPPQLEAPQDMALGVPELPVLLVLPVFPAAPVFPMPLLMPPPQPVNSTRAAANAPASGRSRDLNPSMV